MDENISPFRRLSTIKRIKRLSVMCLPISEYLDILFDLIGIAILCTDHRLVMLGGASERYIARHIDYSKYDTLYRRLFSLSNKETGVRSVAELMAMGKTAILHKDIVLPYYQNGYLYNEINKTLGCYYIIMTRLVDAGKPIGFFTLFRAKNMPPFTKEDALFMEAAAPFIAYGISKSKPVDESFGDPLNFSPKIDRLDESHIGSLLLDKKGDIVYLNNAAKNIFFEIGMSDETIFNINELENNGLMAVVQYINAIIRNILSDNRSCNIMPTRVYTGKTGKSIMIRGYNMEPLNRGTSFVNITLEEVSAEPFLKLKKKLIYNFSEREMEISTLLKENYKPAEISEKFSITRSTFKTHISHIVNKLDLNSANELKRFLAASF